MKSSNRYDGATVGAIKSSFGSSNKYGVLSSSPRISLARRFADCCASFLFDIEMLPTLSIAWMANIAHSFASMVMK